MKPWKTLSKKVIFRQNGLLTVEAHEIELPNGEVIHNWPWVKTPDYINVAAITIEGKFICFKQTKYAVEGISLAPVGGYVEAGEDPLETAKRELLEETGFQAAKWTPLGNYPIDGNRGSGRGWLYLAEDAKQVCQPNADDLEEQELVLLNTGEVQKALFKGEFKVMPWTTVMSLALLHLKNADAIQ